MKKVLLVISMVFCAGVAFSAEKMVKIGYVDLQTVLNESSAGKEARAAFNKRVEEIRKTLDERQGELQKLQEELEKQKGLLTPEARAEKEKTYEKKLKDVQRFAKDSQDELQQKEAEMIGRMIKEIREMVKKVGEDERYTIILEKGANIPDKGVDIVLFAGEGVDITDKVIKAYNKTRK